MSPAPIEAMEHELRSAHAELESARLLGSHGSVTRANDDARKVVSDFLRGTDLHRDALGAFLRHLSEEGAYLNREIERLERLRDEVDSDCRRFRDHVFKAVREAGIVRARGKKALFVIGRSPARVEVKSLAALPAEFVSTQPEQRHVRERALAAALRAGRESPGARLALGGERLVVR